MKYRAVEVVDKFQLGFHVDYIIEKQKRFLFWTWWKRYKVEDDCGHRHFFKTQSKNHVEKVIEILNKNQGRYEFSLLK